MIRVGSTIVATDDFGNDTRNPPDIIDHVIARFRGGGETHPHRTLIAMLEKYFEPHKKDGWGPIAAEVEQIKFQREKSSGN